MRYCWWLFLFCSMHLAAQVPTDSTLKNQVVKDTLAAYEYSKPPAFGFIKHVPGDMWQIAKSPFRKENTKALIAIAVATGALIPVDQQITDGVKNMSRQIGLHAETDYGILLKQGQTKIIKYPKNLNSTLYQMGEGGTSMLVAGGLFVYGKLWKDYRALQTASDITETFITMGVTTQVLKRISGRQSPFMSVHPGG